MRNFHYRDGKQIPAALIDDFPQTVVDRSFTDYNPDIACLSTGLFLSHHNLREAFYDAAHD